MPNQHRVPRPIGLFNTYIVNSTAYLLLNAAPVNWERLLLIQAEMDDWEDYKDQWVALYPTFSDEGTRTKAIILQANNLMDDFRHFSENLLTRMGTSPDINDLDRTTLRIPARDRTITRRGKIEDVPVVSLTSAPGGRIAVSCKISSDASRASMHPLADAIEVRIKIGDPAPATAEECIIVVFPKKAMFDYQAGQANAGKRIYIFCRYVNQSTPANSGEFGTASNIIIEG